MTNTADERAAKIEALANSIINDAKRRDAERRQRNDEQMEKMKHWFATRAEQPAGGPQWMR